MKKFSLKALGATLLAVGLVVAGVASPAQAATSGTISVNSFVGGSSVSSALTITFADTAPTASTIITVNTQSLLMPSSCTVTPTTTLSDCGISSVDINGASAAAGTTVRKGGSPAMIELTLPSSTSVSSSSIIFAANTLSVSQMPTGTRSIFWQIGSNFLQTDYTVTAPPVSSTVTFVANGGTGTMAVQTASSASALTANSFTKSGYTFGGWATSQSNADAGIVAYANGATYDFSTSRTLRAIWVANSSGSGSSSSDQQSLANTGIDSTNMTLFLLGGLSLALIGAVMLMIARRRRSN